MTDREKNQRPIEEPNHPSSNILFFQQYLSQLLLLSLCWCRVAIALCVFVWRWGSLLTGFVTRRMHLRIWISCHKATNSVTSCRARSRAWFTGLCDVGEPSTTKREHRPWCSRLQSNCYHNWCGDCNREKLKLHHHYWSCTKLLAHQQEQEDGCCWCLHHHNQKDAHQTSSGGHVPHQEQQSKLVRKKVHLSVAFCGFPSHDSKPTPAHLWCFCPTDTTFESLLTQGSRDWTSPWSSNSSTGSLDSEEGITQWGSGKKGGQCKCSSDNRPGRRWGGAVCITCEETLCITRPCPQVQ